MNMLKLTFILSVTKSSIRKQRNLKTIFTVLMILGYSHLSVGLPKSKSSIRYEATNTKYSSNTNHLFTSVTKTIDKRTATDATGNVYHLVFIAKPTILADGQNAGHAFVVWGVEDAQRRMSYAQGWGLYPINGLKALTLGKVPGKIQDDGVTSGDYNRLIVKVDKSVYQATLKKMEEWAKEGNYQLLTHDCLSFTIDMATIAQLTTPARTGFDNIPWNYLLSLINAN
ncbi:MAG: hypothetical protein JWQ25_2113 [Daejeonella sp.]|nr:hypothetical protein [Daejeonella sp.]